MDGLLLIGGILFVFAWLISGFWKILCWTGFFLFGGNVPCRCRRGEHRRY